MKHSELCEHTHTHTHTSLSKKEVTKRNLLYEGWCQCLNATESHGGMYS